MMRLFWEWTLVVWMVAWALPAGIAVAQDFPDEVVGARIQYRQSEPGREYQITVELQNLTQDKLGTVWEAGTEYRVFPRIIRGSTLQEVGRPEVPVVQVRVPILAPGKATLSVGKEEPLATWDGLRIVPAREPWAELKDAPRPPALEAPDVYQTDEEFPYYAAARLGPPLVLAGGTFQTCYVHPVRYNPATGSVVLNRVTATLTIDPERGAEAAPAIARAKPLLEYSRTFARAYLALSDGYRPPEADRLFEAIGAASPEAEGGCNYLVITADELADSLTPLVQAKEMRQPFGLKVRVFRLSELGITAQTGAATRREKIREAIEQQYDLVPRPIYLLLVGDYKEIPPYYEVRHTWSLEGFIPSDLPYGTMDGPFDLLPDIAIGRLPAETPAQVKSMVQKIVRYDDAILNPQASLPNALVAADYENARSNPTKTGRWFLQTADSAGRFLANGPQDVGDVFRAYTVSFPDKPVPWLFYDSQQIPDEVVALMKQHAANPGSATALIVDAWDEDLRVAIHRDHGDYDGWVHPQFRVAEIGQLPEPPVPPLVLSINCRSGGYDKPVCFATELMRHPNGACAVVAASRVSWSNSNDRFAEGLMKGIWDEFELDFELPDVDRIVLGDMMSTARSHFVSNYSGPNLQRTLHLFNLFGDPEMTVRIRVGSVHELAPAAVPAGRLRFPDERKMSH